MSKLILKFHNKYNFLLFFHYLYKNFFIFLFFIFFILNNIDIGNFTNNDQPPFPPDISILFDKYFFNYEYKSLGFIHNLVRPLFELLQLIILIISFNNEIVASFMLMSGIYFIAFFCFYKLLSSYFNDITIPTRQLASGLFAVNPIFLAETLAGGTLTTVILFCTAPLYIKYFLDLYFLKEGFRYILKFTILSSIISQISSHGILILSLVSIFILISLLIYSVFDTKNFNKFIFFVFKIIISAILIFLISPFYYIDIVGYVPLLKTDNSLLTENIFNYKSFINDVNYTYQWTSFLHSLRLGTVGNFNFNHNTISNLFGYTLTFLFLTGFIVKSKNKSLLFSKFFSLIIMFFLFLIYFAIEYIIWIFNLFPPLFMFRNPTKISLVLSILFFIIFSYGYDYTVSILNKKLFIVKFSAFIFLILSITIYLSPFFHNFDRGISFYNKDYESIKKREYVFPIRNFILNQTKKNEFPSFLVIPNDYSDHGTPLYYADQYEFQTPEGIADFNYIESQSFINEMYKFIFNLDDINFQKYSFLIKYIILDTHTSVNDDPDSNNISLGAQTIRGNYKKYYNFFSNIGYFEKVKSMKNFVIFENNDYIGPIHLKDRFSKIINNQNTSFNKLKYLKPGLIKIENPSKDLHVVEFYNNYNKIWRLSPSNNCDENKFLNNIGYHPIFFKESSNIPNSNKDQFGMNWTVDEKKECIYLYNNSQKYNFYNILIMLIMMKILFISYFYEKNIIYYYRTWSLNKKWNWWK